MFYRIIAKLLNWFDIKKPDVIVPQIDEQWQLIDNNGPWKTDELPVVTIRDVRDGWVRYKINSSFKFLFQDERLPIKTFVNIYKKVE
jgi:hypothetical protein